MTPNIVVLEKDPELALSLVGLRPRFDVHVTHSREEFRDTVAGNSPEAVVLNIEHWRLTDVESLHHDFPALAIVCTHRLPNEEMWIAALEAGASDVCAADEPENVLRSVLRSMERSRKASA